MIDKKTAIEIGSELQLGRECIVEAARAHRFNTYADKKIIPVLIEQGAEGRVLEVIVNTARNVWIVDVDWGTPYGIHPYVHEKETPLQEILYKGIRDPPYDGPELPFKK